MTGERMSGNLFRSTHDVPARTVYTALMRMAKLSKRSTRWVNKRFSLEMKKERFRTCEVAEAMAAAIL
jgi:hypothetical protein